MNIALHLQINIYILRANCPWGTADVRTPRSGCYATPQMWRKYHSEIHDQYRWYHWVHFAFDSTTSDPNETSRGLSNKQLVNAFALSKLGILVVLYKPREGNYICWALVAQRRLQFIIFESCSSPMNHALPAGQLNHHSSGEPRLVLRSNGIIYYIATARQHPNYS